MKITNKTIAKLNPCQDRHDNYLIFYKGKTHTKAQFLGLKNITHEDKIWVAFRLLPLDSIALCAADIAELVLPIFEAQYPNDLRPRLAIEAARSKTMTLQEKCNAAYTASRAYYASNDAAYATYAATYAADAATYATNAAHAAYATSTANAAAKTSTNAVYAAKLNGHNIEKKIRTIILRYWK